MAESNLETISLAELETSAFSVMKPMLINWICLEEKETRGDKFLFWNEAKAIDSAQRIDALDAKLCELYGNRVNFAVESYLNKGYAEAEARKEALLVALGVFSDECTVLIEEYVKSAAELCIKKMRLGALVDNCDKQSKLMIEVRNAIKKRQEIRDKFAAFNKNLSVTRKQQQMQQDSHACVFILENDVGGAPDKSGKNDNMESLISNLKLGAGFTKETLRVVVEMMRYGVEEHRPLFSRLEDAWKVGRIWFYSLTGIILQEVCVAAIVDRVSVFEVLKRQIAYHWKMEKEVRDKIINYQREHAHLAQGFVTTVKGETSGVVKE